MPNALAFWRKCITTSKTTDVLKMELEVHTSSDSSSSCKVTTLCGVKTKNISVYDRNLFNYPFSLKYYNVCQHAMYFRVKYYTSMAWSVYFVWFIQIKIVLNIFLYYRQIKHLGLSFLKWKTLIWRNHIFMYCNVEHQTCKGELNSITVNTAYVYTKSQTAFFFGYFSLRANNNS